MPSPLGHPAFWVFTQAKVLVYMLTLVRLTGLLATMPGFGQTRVPVQVRIIPVSEKFEEYAKKIVEGLRAKMVRAELDPTQDTMGKKIRNGTKQKIPNLLIVGEKEQVDGTITLRRYGLEKQETMPVAAFETWLLDRIVTRARG